MGKAFNKDYEAFLNRYIPSQDMRSKIRETGHVFSDWERATIIWNSEIPLEDKHDELQKIAKKTSDEALREQIGERLDYDKECQMLTYRSNELHADRALKLEMPSNKRFENRFVVFPEVFKTNEKVRIIDGEGGEGRIAPTIWNYEEFIRKASAEDSIMEYMDVAIPVIYGDKAGEHWHVNPIYLERVDDDTDDRYATDEEVLSATDELYAEYKDAFEKLAE